MSEEIEEWRAVAGFEGAYEVSDHGRIRSLDRQGCDGRRLQGRIFKPGRNEREYPRAVLRKGGDSATRLVHRLVLYAFAGPPPPGAIHTRHLDGTRNNNRPRNLAWSTCPENFADKVRHGTSNRGTQRGWSKLTPLQVRCVKALIAMGASDRMLGRTFKVTASNISAIRKGRSWWYVEVAA